MRAKAFHRKRSSDADNPFVFIRLVIEVFEFSFRGNGLIYFLLPSDSGLPTVGMQNLFWIRPLGIGFTRDLPFLPGLS